MLGALDIFLSSYLTICHKILKVFIKPTILAIVC